METTEYDELGIAYRALFDVLHLKRLTKKLDTYGFGRRLSNIDPTFILTFTIPGSLIISDGPSDKVRLYNSMDFKLIYYLKKSFYTASDPYIECCWW